MSLLKSLVPPTTLTLLVNNLFFSSDSQFLNISRKDSEAIAQGIVETFKFGVRQASYSNEVPPDQVSLLTANNKVWRVWHDVDNEEIKVYI